VNDIYLNLTKQGWTIPAIDKMDIFFYFQLIKHAGREKQKTTLSDIDAMGFI
jgi:hypothetical protein